MTPDGSFRFGNGWERARRDLEHLISLVKQSTRYLVHPGHLAVFSVLCIMQERSRGSGQSVTGAAGNDIQGAHHKRIPIDYPAAAPRSDILRP